MLVNGVNSYQNQVTFAGKGAVLRNSQKQISDVVEVLKMCEGSKVTGLTNDVLTKVNRILKSDRKKSHLKTLA
ncbi:MAG: hypothetical protein PHC34_05440 [Candidatus Gastranaerophilales bacterium]|nr:hypothetical protein [Candidatus Gastranaerophilales bacterium]